MPLSHVSSERESAAGARARAGRHSDRAIVRPGASHEAHKRAHALTSAPVTAGWTAWNRTALLGARPKVEEQALAAGVASSSETSSGAAQGQSGPLREVDPWDRSLDRLLAKLGLLSEALPQFGTCQKVAGLGCCWRCQRWSRRDCSRWRKNARVARVKTAGRAPSAGTGRRHASDRLASRTSVPRRSDTGPRDTSARVPRSRT